MEEHLISVLALVFIALAMMQRRFLVAATPFIAITAAEGLLMAASQIHRQIDRLSGKDRLEKAGQHSGTFGVIAVVVTLIPSLITNTQIEPLTPRDRAMYSAATAIREIVTDHAEPGAPTTAGVLAPWGYGHLLKYSAGVPTVCDNFFGVPGSDAAIMRCLNIMYSIDDSFIRRQFDDLQIRFVVIVPPHPDQIRVETELLGLNPSAWANPDGQLTALFAQSFYGRTGIWASNARVGHVGPWSLKLKGKFKQVNPETREILSEVFLLERIADQVENSPETMPATDSTPQNH